MNNIDSDDRKKASFKAHEANSKVWLEDILKNLSKKDGPMGATFMGEMIK